VAGTPGGDEPRIEPLPPDQWPEAMKGALAALRPVEPRYPFPKREPGRPKGLNVLGTFAQHPALATAYHTFNGHILFATTLSERQRELLVLRVAAVRQCEYEWTQHLVLAADVGLTDEDVDRVAEGPDATGWSSLDGAMVRAVDELLGDGVIADDTWAVLATELDTQQLMDLVFTVGAYETLALAMRSFGMQLDDDLDPYRRKRYSPE